MTSNMDPPNKGDFCHSHYYRCGQGRGKKKGDCKEEGNVEHIAYMLSVRVLVSPFVLIAGVSLGDEAWYSLQ